MPKVKALHIDHTLIDSAQSLQLLARHLAKGLLVGRHQSQRLGTGMEFAQYRAYTQGDDIRLLDWKMYAKTGKYFIRQSSIETQNNLTIHIDNSKSMDYQENDLSKLDIAKIICATLHYIATQQGDRSGWESSDFINKMSGGWQNWNNSLVALHELKTKASDTPKYKLVNSGVHVWITDLYSPLATVESIIKSVIHKHSELIIIHLMGRQEENLTFAKDSYFIDLETNEKILLNADSYRDSYKDRLGSHISKIQGICNRNGVMLYKSYIQDDLSVTLRDILNKYNWVAQ